MILFASDYPHWDADAPAEIARRLPADLREKIMFANAERFYRLDTQRVAND
jgi:predicted TIM-barrel fold metal-dependent hydrolase